MKPILDLRDARQRIAALEAELAAAKQDTERLDWLEQRVPVEGMFGPKFEGRDMLRHVDLVWSCGGYFKGDTARAAIDAARGSK